MHRLLGVLLSPLRFRLSRHRSSPARLAMLGLGAVVLLLVTGAGTAVAMRLGPGASPPAKTTTTKKPGSPKGKPLPNDPTVTTVAPVCGDQDGSETPLITNCPQYTQVVDRRYYQVPGSGSVTVHFDFVYREASCASELAVFKVDDTNGSINGVLPGAPSWPTQVASRNPQVAFATGSTPSTPDADLTFQGGDILALRFAACSSTFYSYEQANTDGFDHLLAFQHSAGQPWQFAWEDLSGGGDSDFDDAIYNLSVGGAAGAADAQHWGQCSGGGIHALAASVCTQDPVNSFTGAFTTSQTDLTLPGLGLGFAFTRSYTSADPAIGRLGRGWTDSYSASLAVQPNGDVLLHGEDGQRVYYTKQQDGSFTGAAGAQSKLSSINGGYQLVRHDQVVYTFDSSGVLQSMRDRNNHTVSFVYDGSGRLTGITDAVGRTVTLSYNASNFVSSVATPDGRTVSYGYTSGALTSVTLPDPDGAGPLAAPVWHYTYDPSGRLATIVDPDNHTAISNVYDSATGRVTSQTDATNHTTTFAWDAATQTATITDARSNVWKDVYTNGVLTKRIDATSKTTQLGHDASLDTTSVIAPDGSSTTSMTYDARGNLLQTTGPASIGGPQKTYTYDAQNNLTSATDARNKVSTYGYDANGNLTSITLAGVTTAQYAYNAQGEQTSSTDGNNRTTTSTYNANGNVVSSTDPLGNTTTYTYDAAGNLASSVSPLGNVAGGNPDNYRTTYAYDADGRLLSTTDPLGNTTTYAYDAASNPTSVTDPKNHTTTYAYDNANRLVTTTGPDPDGAGPLTAPVTTYTYDAAGNRVTATDPRGHTTTNAYDADNRLASISTSLGKKTSYTYDTNGNLAGVVDPRGNVTGANPADYTTSFTYDIAGRLLSKTDPLGNTTSYAYDAVGHLSSVTDAKNHTTSYTYDDAGRTLTVTKPDGGVTTYTYDANGNKLTSTDAKGHTTSYAYNFDSLLVSATGPDPDGGGPLTAPLTTYSYDANGNRVSRVDPNGNASAPAGDGTTTYTYDRDDRLTATVYSDGTPTVSISYDAAGNRTAVGSTTYTYDGLDRVSTVTRGTDTFSYAYDAANNVTSRTYPDGTVTTYAYDDDNQLSSATSGGVTTGYAYDAAEELTQTTLPSANGYVETRTYDRVGRLIDVKNAKAGSTLSEYAYTLDPVGNPTTVAQTGAVSSTTTYGYDGNDRLTSVCYQASCPNGGDPFIRWTYDQVGNRLTESRPASSTTYTYNAADELTQSVQQGTSQYASQVTSDGAQPYWRFGESSGSTFASSVGTFNGTWTGSPTLGAPGALNGDTNTSVTLNGTSQYGTVANASQLNKANNFSIEVWIKRSKSGASQAVVGKPLTTTTKSENYALWLDTTNKVRFEVGSGTKSAALTSGSALDTGWHHVVGTFASGVMKLYLDASLQATGTATFTSAGTNTSTLDVGRSGTTNYYGGGLDELALYGTALTATQVTDHYTKGVNAAQTTNYSYDQNGNETAAGGRTFQYDLENRLVSTVFGATDTFTYDGNGNRLSDTRTSPQVGLIFAFHYFWDQANPIPQLATEVEDTSDGPGVFSATYTYGVRRIGINTGGASYYYHYDGLGSVANVTSATGATQWTYAYEPFGATRTQTQNGQNAPTNSFKFTGEYLDSLSFYALRAREYDPTSGRFTTVDPLRGAADSQPQSLYVYANDDPTQFTDPTGKGPSAPATDFPDATSEATSSADDDTRVLAMHDPGGGGSPPLWGLPFPLTTHFDGPDQGVDYRPTHAVKAIGAGHIYHHSPPGSYTTPFGDGDEVYEHLDHAVKWGGHTYYNIYYSEQASIVKSGPVVVGQPVMIKNADELGFAKNNQSITRPHGKLVRAPGGWTYPTVEGCDFYNFLYWIERSYLKLPPSPKKRCYPVVPYQPD